MCFSIELKGMTSFVAQSCCYALVISRNETSLIIYKNWYSGTHEVISNCTILTQLIYSFWEKVYIFAEIISRILYCPLFRDSQISLKLFWHKEGHWMPPSWIPKHRKVWDIPRGENSNTNINTCKSYDIHADKYRFSQSVIPIFTIYGSSCEREACTGGRKPYE